MSNLNAFLGYFISYLILFGVFVCLLLIGCFIGITLRKKKNAEQGITEVSAPAEGSAGA